MTNCAGDGLILHIAPHGESDKLVTWYSAQHGRITAIAKGAQKSKKRFSNKLEPFSQLCLYYRPPRSPSGLYFLEDADLIHANLAVRQEYVKNLAACCIAELTLRFTRELDADSRIYAMLTWSLTAINGQARFFKYPLFFHLKLLQLAGYMPAFATCATCGKVMHEAGSLCLGSQGMGAGLVRCRSCLPGQGNKGHGLSLQTMRMLDFAQHADCSTLHKLQPALSSILEGLDILSLYSQHLLQADLHSWRILRQQLRPSVQQTGPMAPVSPGALGPQTRGTSSILPA